MNKQLLHRVGLAVVPRLLWCVTSLWFATLRVRYHDEEHKRKTLDAGQAIIFTCWHYSLFLLFQIMRGYRGVVMVSSSRDGDYIARFAELFGLTAVRGSRNRQGTQALKGLLAVCREGRSVGLVADGSQGPAMVAQPGSILMASRTGNQILPAAWSASSYFTLRSWDSTAFPLPFSRVDVVFGEPLAVAEGLDSDGVEQYRQNLEARLNAIYQRAWQLQGRESHYTPGAEGRARLSARSRRRMNKKKG